MGDINWLQLTTGLTTQELSNLFCYRWFRFSSRQLTKEAEKELTLVEKRLQDAYVNLIDTKMDFILVILPSIHSPAGLIMQREDSILEWIFLAQRQSKNLKTYAET